ncbi:small heat shock protein, putative [Plasmodium knowlesi strain H]|uniref:Small heat shock protein, putative n=3 Tax=Plasmodium knowlesi TaxID=5850 RepID=A0A5K1TZQ7_PLAKH|nr:small heat shock protein, putative [Plasmodium knowlesi strain H]OTN64269.1 putative Small heat shock protein [Plasmodium knowlesi]CAA9990646.1 small heat shock protein, putative [Plasmodium knowlesi strain H]SBO25994.1 small heat shock protein, putative [Plasmodium knowlesi strain H]SBO28712.1 small heat shock protein, putative [Plasmodium knowlesi strain H]VVS80120.1 small heat shock protein, putative [Plasmodium knowlesi strain H]|eukprot:XP_002261937.1 small heat shock protein, putative [Plasmodium knowlesi strain H]
MVMNDITKSDTHERKDEVTMDKGGMFNNFFECMNEQMKRIDRYHEDMSRMMNSMRTHYFSDELSKYFPSRRSLLDYDLGDARRNDLFFGKPQFLMDRFKNVPPMDVVDKDKEIEIKIDVPGLSKDNVQINLYNRNLEVSGDFKKTEETRDDEQRYYVKERSQTSFYRSFQLPENVCEDNIKATFKDGVLKIDIPKKDVLPEKKKKIEIQ